jgi:hypothetical protein
VIFALFCVPREALHKRGRTVSAAIIDLGHERLKQQLASSLALLEAAGVSTPANTLEQPKLENDLGYAQRLVGDASKLLRSGDLLAAANALESAARYLRRLGVMSR